VNVYYVFCLIRGCGLWSEYRLGREWGGRSGVGDEVAPELVAQASALGWGRGL
jgi:hypothetical protein